MNTTFLQAENKFPAVILGEGIGNKEQWAASHQEEVQALVQQFGAVLLRGFEIGSPAEFEGIVKAIGFELYGQYGDLPKESGGKEIYKSTPYPTDMKIMFHNESSHMASWPSIQGFYCDTPSPVGGCTPIVDCRLMAEKMDPEVLDAFKSKGVVYIRNFHKRIDVSWQNFFKTESLQEAKQQCLDKGIEFIECDNGVIQTRSHAPAVIKHPVSGMYSFFNQIQLHHPSYVVDDVREVLMAMVGKEYMPRNVMFGDGTEIPDSYLTEINRLYDSCSVRFPWQKSDVLILDNMSVAHARDEYEGERKICVALGNMFMRSDLPALA